MAQKPRVGLFVTCLVDMHRPNVGFAAIRLLEQAGCEVVVPEAQTCCGQPAWNSGDDATTRALAIQLMDAFVDVDYIVAPSGSCAGMLKKYPELLADEPALVERAGQFAEKTHELMSFLVDVLGHTDITARFDHHVTYHDSCSGLRDLNIKAQPRTLLDKVQGLSLSEMEDTEVCCGFGGTFCVKYPDISERMVSDKIALANQSGADVLLGGDLGCLLNISGRLSRLDMKMQVWHTAEILADMTDVPAIGQADERASRG